MPPSLILVTRPEPAAGITAASLRAAGYRVLASPALAATAQPPRDLALPAATTLIVTSPQAARHLQAWKPLHAYNIIAVGAQTAVLLQAAGCARITDAGGDAAAILALTANGEPQAYCLLGAPSTGRALATALRVQGHRVRRIAVYRVDPAPPLAPDAAAALARGQVTHILFYSARTAASFLALAADTEFQLVTALCLSGAVAQAAQAGGFGTVLIAARPTAEALQALLPALD